MCRSSFLWFFMLIYGILKKVVCVILNEADNMSF